MTEDKIDVPTPVPSVSMPSADLINFRFDQNDRKTDSLSRKLDKLTIHFATKEEFMDLRNQVDKWSVRIWGLAITIIILAGGVIAAFIERGPK